MASKKFDHFYQKLIAKAIPAGLPVEEVRAAFEKWMAEYPPPENTRFEKFTIGATPACWIIAPGAERHNIVLFFFGGSYTAGSIQSHRGLLGRLSAASGSAVLAIDYRLAPEHPFPEGLEDAFAAYLWLIHHPYPPNRIALAGISAGSGLSLALLFKLKLEKKTLPKAVLCLCPWVDLAMKAPSIRTNNGKDLLKPERLAWAVDQYAAGKDPKDPFISPLYGDLSGLPPLFIQSGTRDLIHDEAMQLGEKAKKSGTEVTLDVWPDMVHAWQLFYPAFPESQEAVVKAGEFLKRAFQPGR